MAFGQRHPARPRLAWAIVSIGLILGTAAPSTAADEHPDRRIVRGKEAGDIVRGHGLAIVVPARGETAWGELLLADGGHRVLLVRTARDGTVTLTGASRRAGDAAARSLATATSTPAECADSYNARYPWRMPDLQWRFQARSAPSYLRDAEGGVTGVLAAISRAQTNVTTGRNVCGRPDAIDAEGGPVGLAKRGPGITSGAACAGGDGVSVVGFGALPSYAIAMACAYDIRAGIASEGDVRIASTVRWALSKAACSGSRFLIEAVMTHEFGHLYGLAHASTHLHPTLTMQPSVGYCKNAHSTLGLGDLLGLERKY